MAVNKIQTKAAASILGLCFLWYIVSSTNNVVGKMLLNEFPYPMTVTMVQLTSITVYSGPFLRLWGVRPYNDLKNNYYYKIILPLAIGKFIASVFTHVSLWKVSVSYAHTVKATMPLFTVVLSRIILGETQTHKVYMSLVPIIIGVAIATLTELSFDMVGLISTLVATCGLSLQNIFSKKVLHDTGVHHLRLLQILGRLALLMFLPVWLFFDFRDVISHPSVASGDSYKVIILLLADGCLNWLQNVLAFSVMSLVSPLTYAVANASKRLFVIGLSLIVLGNPVTIVNVFGMTMAVFGVLLYNKAKYDARQVEKKQTILPMNNHSSQSNLGYMSLPSVPPNTDYFQRYTNSNVTLVRPHVAHTNGTSSASNGWSRYGSPTLNSVVHKQGGSYNITSI